MNRHIQINASICTWVSNVNFANIIDCSVFDKELNLSIPFDCTLCFIIYFYIFIDTQFVR